MLKFICNTVVFGSLSLVLMAAPGLVACTSEEAPAARDAPPRTMAPELAEPEVEAIDQRRIEASSKVVVEPEPAPMPEDEKAGMVEHEDHDHGDEDTEEDKTPEGKPAATMSTTNKSTAAPAKKKPKSLIR
jgi:hypothetical protein